MSEYALLMLPSANRVYAQAAAELTLAELAVFNDTVLGGRLGDLATAPIGGVGYVTFECRRPVRTGHAVAVQRLGRLRAVPA